MTTEDLVLDPQPARRRKKPARAEALITELNAADEQHTVGEQKLTTYAFISTTVVAGLAEMLHITALVYLSMIAYALFVWLRARRQFVTEQFADSVYYQGFVLTLWSLAFALRFGDVTDAGGANLVRQFGYAITSTVIGMTGRVFLLNIYRSVDERETDSRIGLATHVKALEVQIQRTAVALDEVARKSVAAAESSSQHMGQIIERSGDASSRAFDNSAAAMLGAVSRVGDRLDAAVEDLRRRLTGIEIPAEIVSDQLSASARALQADVERFRGVLEQSTVAFAGTLGSSATTIIRIRDEVIGIEKSIASVGAALHKTSDLTQASGDRTAQFAQQTSEAADMMARFNQRVAAMVENVQELDRSIAGRAGTLNDDLGRVVSELREVATKANADALAFTAAMVNSTESIRGAIDEAKRS